MYELNGTFKGYSTLVRKLHVAITKHPESLSELPPPPPFDSDYNSYEYDARDSIDIHEFIKSANDKIVTTATSFTPDVNATIVGNNEVLQNIDYWLSSSMPPFVHPASNDTFANHTNPLDCKIEYNPTSSETYTEFWVSGVLLNVIGILGIIGNVVSMIILSRPQMRSSINYLLIGLARCDTALIITSIVIFGIPSIYPYTGSLFYYFNDIYPFISYGVYPIAIIAQTASIYVTFTVTLERYVAVCHPLRARALCTYGRAKLYFIACIIFSTLYNLPRFWEVQVMSKFDAATNEILYCVRPSKLRQNETYVNVYVNWCYLIVNYVIPFLTLAVFNCLIYRQVKRANRERQRLSRSEKREIGLATMLLCVVMVFFLFNLPACVMNTTEAFYKETDHNFKQLSNLLVTINSSCNFLIYVIFGEKFKRIFLLIFFKRRLSRDQPDLIHYESSISNNGDGTMNNRSSGRLSRHGTQRSSATTFLFTGSGNNTLKNMRLTQPPSGSPSRTHIKRGRAHSPGPVVYLPARGMQRAITDPIMVGSNNNTASPFDWIDAKNGQKTSGF